jgi:hypothetical protein
MRLVLAKGRSQYGSLRLHIDQLGAALRELGHEAVVVDLIEEDGSQAAVRALSGPTDALIAMGGMALELAIPGRFFETPHFPVVSLYVDHPLHHVASLKQQVRRRAAFFLDRSHVGFMSTWSAGKSLTQIGFLPPGANELAEPADVSDDGFARRDIGLLFTGTYRGEPQPGWLDWPVSAARELTAETAERMTADARLPILDALRAVLARRQVKLTGDLLDGLAPLLGAAQLFAEAYHRHALLTVLGKAAVPVQVYGSGWEPLCARHPSFAYGGVGSFEETLHLLRRSRLVLNVNNGFVAGGHERVFTAMCAGAAVISDASRWYAEAFKEGQEIAIFSWPKLEQLPDQIMKLQADTAGLAKLARAGHRRATSEHRWSARAGRLIKTVQAL